MHNKRRHQILLMTPNDFHTPLDCSSLHLLFYIHSSFVYRNDVLDKSPFIRSSLSALFCTLSLVSIPECLFFHQVKPDDLCLVVPFGLYLLTLDFTSRAFSSPFVMAACFFVVLNITRILHYVNLFFYFFLFSLYISHNCLFYYVFSDNLFFLKKNVLSHALFLYLCRHSQIVSLKQIHSQRP